MALGMTIDELIERIDPLSYWSFHAGSCQAAIGTPSACSCNKVPAGFVLVGGLYRVELCDEHVKRLALALLTASERVFDLPYNSIPYLAAHMTHGSFFSYTGKCDVVRSNMQVCGSSAVSFFTTVDGKQIKTCHSCACRILYALTNEQPELWLKPGARAENHILKMLKKWSNYDRIQLAPPLC